jgi:hypothetical protein
MFSSKLLRYGMIACGLLLVVGCTLFPRDKLFIDPAYSFNQDKVWVIVPLKFSPELGYVFGHKQLEDLGQLLADRLKDRLEETGIKAFIPQESTGDITADYMIQEEIVTIAVGVKKFGSEYAYDRGRSRVRLNKRGLNSSYLKIGISGQIIQLNTNTVDTEIAHFELYKSTPVEQFKGIDILLDQFSTSIVDIVLGKKKYSKFRGYIK